MIEAEFSFYIGVESANSADLKLFNKRATVEDNVKIFDLLKQNNGRFKYGFIMFTPYSTTNSIKSNFSFLLQHHCANLFAYMSVLQIFYNSEIYHKLKDDNLLLEYYHYIDNTEENAVKYIDSTVQSITKFISNILTKSDLMSGANEYLNFWRNYDFLSIIMPNAKLSAEKMEFDKKLLHV